MIFNLMKPVPTTESATMYLYGHEAETDETITAYIGDVGYVGAVLPPLPVWDKETYPYAVITRTGAFYYFCISDSPFNHSYRDDRKDTIINTTGFCVFSCTKYTGWEQVDNETAYPVGDIPGVHLIWANHEIITTDGSVYLEATEPIPLGEIVAYSYNGTVLPKLPEWDKTAYPYAYIVYKDSDSIVSGSYYASLYLCANPVTVYYSVSIGITFTRLKIIGERLVYGMVSDEKMLESTTEGMSAFLGDLAYLSEPNKWEYMTTTTEETVTNYESKYIWFNHDVIDTEGAVKFSASEPVPVYE